MLVLSGYFRLFRLSTAWDDIKLGLDLAGGVSITYQAKEANPLSEDMADTIYKLQQRVQNYSTEAEVYQEGRQPYQRGYSRRFRRQRDTGGTGQSPAPLYS